MIIENSNVHKFSLLYFRFFRFNVIQAYANKLLCIYKTKLKGSCKYKTKLKGNEHRLKYS